MINLTIKNVNGMRIGTNTVHEVKVTSHVIQFHKFLVWLFVKDMIMGNNTTDYTSMNNKYFFIMTSIGKSSFDAPLQPKKRKWNDCHEKSLTDAR